MLRGVLRAEGTPALQGHPRVPERSVHGGPARPDTARASPPGPGQTQTPQPHNGGTGPPFSLTPVTSETPDRRAPRAPTGLPRCGAAVPRLPPPADTPSPLPSPPRAGAHPFTTKKGSSIDMALPPAPRPPRPPRRRGHAPPPRHAPRRRHAPRACANAAGVGLA